MGFHELARCPAKFSPGRQISRGFASNKNMTFLSMRTNDFISPQWEKTSTGVGRSSTGQWQEKTGQGEEDWKINDCWVWTETAKDEDRIRKDKSVREMDVWVGVNFHFYYSDYNSNYYYYFVLSLEFVMFHALPRSNINNTVIWYTTVLSSLRDGLNILCSTSPRLVHVKCTAICFYLLIDPYLLACQYLCTLNKL
jgi:hypothetical protein